MADLDPAHVEVICEVMHNAYEVAAVVSGWETNAASRKPWREVPEANQETMRAAVRAILTSTDPAVHAALLAALVRAGVLDVEKRCRCSCGGEFGAATHAFNAVHDASPIERRYVTRWEDVDV